MSVKRLNRSTVASSKRVAGSTVQRFGDLTVIIANRQRTKPINRRLLKVIARTLLAGLEVQPAELGVTLAGAAEMTRLNEAFLRHAGSTDVIAFDYRTGARPDRVARPAVHGEIFVCVDEAVRQARRFRTSWQSEIVRYLVHGVLHLIGYDDRRPAARRRMKREENRRLAALTRRFSLAQLSHPARISP